jgi:hypothetical protein
MHKKLFFLVACTTSSIYAMNKPVMQKVIAAAAECASHFGLEELNPHLFPKDLAKTAPNNQSLGTLKGDVYLWPEKPQSVRTESEIQYKLRQAYKILKVRIRKGPISEDLDIFYDIKQYLNAPADKRLTGLAREYLLHMAPEALQNDGSEISPQYRQDLLETMSTWG